MWSRPGPIRNMIGYSWGGVMEDIFRATLGSTNRVYDFSKSWFSLSHIKVRSSRFLLVEI